MKGITFPRPSDPDGGIVCRDGAPIGKITVSKGRTAIGLACWQHHACRSLCPGRTPFQECAPWLAARQPLPQFSNAQVHKEGAQNQGACSEAPAGASALLVVPERAGRRKEARAMCFCCTWGHTYRGRSGLNL